MDSYLKRFEAINPDKVREVVENEFKKLNVVDIPKIDIGVNDLMETMHINFANIKIYIYMKDCTWYSGDSRVASVIDKAFINLVVDELNRVC